MDEPIIEPVTEAVTDEVIRLRKANVELLQTKHTSKARIEELELSATAMQAKLATAETHVHELTIQGPLKAMAASISKAPAAFLDEFAKTYKVEMQDKQLALLHVADNTPVLVDKKPVPFEREAIIKLLESSEGDAKALYRAIIIANRASGGQGRFVRDRAYTAAEDTDKKPLSTLFGLK